MDEEIKKMLEQNLRLSSEIYKQTKYIKKYVFLAQIGSVIKILFIIVPIILCVIYLPPLLKGIFNQYKEILGIQNNNNNSTKNLLKGMTENLNFK